MPVRPVSNSFGAGARDPGLSAVLEGFWIQAQQVFAVALLRCTDAADMRALIGREGSLTEAQRTALLHNVPRLVQNAEMIRQAEVDADMAVRLATELHRRGRPDLGETLLRREIEDIRELRRRLDSE